MRKKSIPSCSFRNPCSSLHGLTRMFKCDLCGKSFSSGNALGGHKTSHRSQNLLRSLCSSPCRHHGEKQKHCCHVCRKVFPSDKALYGHMRSHKRDGKNVIHPPPTTSSLEDVEDQFLLGEIC
ncbi:hypothetical protein P8452_01774 [Trifolium repens]|nr:hypothetical protein P8452_01774 [Trifolium repens]